MLLENHMRATGKTLFKLHRRVGSSVNHKRMLHFSWNPWDTHCSCGHFEDDSFPCVHTLLCWQYFPARYAGTRLQSQHSAGRSRRITQQLEPSLLHIVSMRPSRVHSKTKSQNTTHRHLPSPFRCITPTPLQPVTTKVHKALHTIPTVSSMPTHRLVVTVASTLTFSGRHQHWHNLLVKVASFLRMLRPILGQNCNLVLGLSAHLPFFGYVFSWEEEKAETASSWAGLW